jgi:histidinol-phosphate aminotransferase
MKPLELLLRHNILKLTPYSSARNEFTGDASVFLDANENPYNAPYNRYPDPYQNELKTLVARLKGVNTNQLFFGNGSDEPIDLLFRAFCEPQTDNAILIDPTYGMYQVAADINNVLVKKVALTQTFGLNIEELLGAADENSKLLFLCSPNNPTGNCFNADDIEHLIKQFNGIVVLDEAYIDFAPEKSFLPRLNEFPNLVILQTFSKAWGMAGIRLGMAFASEAIIRVLNKIKYPYNINILTQQKAIELLKTSEQKDKWIDILLKERATLENIIGQYSWVRKVFPSDANFLLVKVDDAKAVYHSLVTQKIIVRDRSSVSLCNGCLRITVGTPEENQQLIIALNNYTQTTTNT